jgi:hypothetical protein
VWPTVFSAPWENRVPFKKTFATLQLETSANIFVTVPQVPRSLFRLRLVASSCVSDHRLGTTPSRITMTTRPIRLGFGVWRVSVWPTVLSAPLVNLDLIMETFATLEFETSASVPVGVSQVPRSHFRLGLVSNSRFADRCLETLPIGNSRTTGPIRLGFGVWGSAYGRLHFGRLR